MNRGVIMRLNYCRLFPLIVISLFAYKASGAQPPDVFVRSDLWQLDISSYSFEAEIGRTDYMIVDDKMTQSEPLSRHLVRLEEPLKFSGHIKVVCNDGAFRLDEIGGPDNRHKYSEYENASAFMCNYDGSEFAAEISDSAGILAKGATRSEIFVFLPQTFMRKWGRFPWLNNAGLREDVDNQWQEDPIIIEGTEIGGKKYIYYRWSKNATNAAGPVDQRVEWEIDPQGLPARVTLSNASKERHVFNVTWMPLSGRVVPKSILLQLYMPTESMGVQLFRELQWTAVDNTFQMPTTLHPVALQKMPDSKLLETQTALKTQAQDGGLGRYLAQQSGLSQHDWRKGPLVFTVAVIIIAAVIGLYFKNAKKGGSK